ncbi:hypothetical protein WBG78_00595 [Chryseolinea sp. T2]|uniref:hypothetical protein n=1 Tax=Chryseolinea sp. T2 TaxID=3129255 RepID=UPI003077D5BF
MTNKRKDSLRTLLRQVELPAPPAEFTAEVMREINPLPAETPIDLHLKTVLQDVRLPEPSVDFTYKVQKEIKRLSQPQPSKPVITSRVWIAIAVFMIVCVAMSMNSSSGVPADGPIYFTKLAAQVTKITTSFHEPLLYTEVIIASAALLLGLEHILRRLSHSRNA